MFLFEEAISIFRFSMYEKSLALPDVRYPCDSADNEFEMNVIHLVVPPYVIEFILLGLATLSGFNSIN